MCSEERTGDIVGAPLLFISNRDSTGPSVCVRMGIEWGLLRPGFRIFLISAKVCQCAELGEGWRAVD